MPLRLRPIVLLALCAPIGCDPLPTDPPPEPATAERPMTGARFDPSTAGTIRGQVQWQGEVPSLPPIEAAIPKDDGTFGWDKKPNPFTPVVDETTHGLAHAIVFLKGVDPKVGRPWDLPLVRIEMTGYCIVVKQAGNPDGRVGFIRSGDEVEMVSTDPAHHMLRARGAMNFTLPFPDPNKPLRRKFDSPGQVELTSGAGYYWTAAELFVDDHPYYTVSDREGRFTLPRVPRGKYELVCRVRNWHIAETDRDPQTGLISRHRFGNPVEKVVPVVLGSKGSVEIPFQFEAKHFTADANRQ